MSTDPQYRVNFSGGARRRRRRQPPTASRLKGPRKQKSFAYKLLKRGLANLMSPTSTSGVAPPLVNLLTTLLHIQMQISNEVLDILEVSFIFDSFLKHLTGFLSTGDEAAPGNAGLKDQSMALRWVRDNIAAFGGDPHSVTLTGCSAGGASVHYHYLSPLSKGTFARGVAFSGSAFASWTHAVKPAQKARTLASLLGCPLDTSREMVDCLRFRPAEAVVQGQIDMFEWSIHLFTTFTPTAEPTDTKEAFLTRYPYQAAQSGQMSRLPLIAGVCSEEGLYPAASYRGAPGVLEDLEAHWNELASNIFEYNDTLPAAERATVAAAIKQHYLDGKPINENTFAQLVQKKVVALHSNVLSLQALGDRLFAADVARLVQLHSRSGQPVHLYRYSFRGNKSVSNLMTNNNEDYGVSHADDVIHIWQLPGFEVEEPEDVMMSRNLVDMLYSYAKTGTPQFNGVQWTPVTPGSQEINYLEIYGPKQAKMASSSDFGQRSFWDSLGFIENENYNPHIKDEL
ncbi:Venom carboxylesterase-6 [Eumeta japonica]|uniref:Carboxylic ester hydrolase n=1 Tax=Eumeta variegata TaxID=151549 RepID=A0A4C1STY5_EUMVA|nr:Venom carboxylesterase-6 [Eumeta japonica]